jgi:hypothetical protein
MYSKFRLHLEAVFDGDQLWTAILYDENKNPLNDGMGKTPEHALIALIIQMAEEHA